MIETNGARDWPEQRSREFARERILEVLGTTQRPMRWAELADVLGGLTPHARMECEWLMDHGYIAPIQAADADDEVLWTFGERGLAWAECHGETMPSDQESAREHVHDVPSHNTVTPGMSQSHRVGAAQDSG
jgi:hypothetical protein